MPDPIAFTKIPVNENEVHSILKSGACSIVNNFLEPKIMNNGSMGNMEADQPKKLALMQGDDVDVMRVSQFNKDMSDTKKKHNCIW